MPPPRVCYLPHIRLYAKPDGELDDKPHVRPRRIGGHPPVDDAWWREVMYDPRARVPTVNFIDLGHQDAAYRLDRQRMQIVVACPCGKTATLDRDAMIRQCGPSMNVIYLVREWMPCKTRNKVSNWCRAYVVI